VASHAIPNPRAIYSISVERNAAFLVGVLRVVEIKLLTGI
jgi:hypothetical protein